MQSWLLISWPWDGEIILKYPGEQYLIAWVLKMEGEKAGESFSWINQESVAMWKNFPAINGFDEGGSQPEDKECEQLLEAGRTRASRKDKALLTPMKFSTANLASDFQPTKLEDNKCVLFEAMKCVVNFHSTVGRKYTYTGLTMWPNVPPYMVDGFQGQDFWETETSRSGVMFLCPYFLYHTAQFCHYSSRLSVSHSSSVTGNETQSWKGTQSQKYGSSHFFIQYFRNIFTCHSCS